ncbi:putative transcriptional regulator, AsnC family [Alkalidesulfovibrio alkalitolerans DSM 16529]|uniref:siroheme decarboxylase n=1 Tax=Alkalidesulfovibrio alkalitolerans DSM 16529 TaxID=1121439 RepID=S7TDW1_9BACT|nr:winged helix-turn-helix transcriptional regulator [Alkalidesulfovibrio alkalitolerans]EPR35392.1 putative transcriptional regulator, AsnC family [Alkalidesulfovibrio alkalitolerans DSM 16529]
MAPLNFTDAEKRALAILQRDLPDSATPFADVATATGLSEAEVIALVKRLKDEGVIRRFGATLRHQKAGYGHNAMVAWYAEDGVDLDAVGAIFAARPEISHCYVRRNCMDWPYNFYTMIHGSSPGDCLRVVEELIEATGIPQYDILESVRELKKTSMVYFAKDDGDDDDPV